VRGSTSDKLNDASRQRFIAAIEARIGQGIQDPTLLNRTANFRKHVVSIRPDKPDRAHNNYQNDRQHNGVFGNVLALLIVPKALN